jgi:hypothetical protein
MHATARRRLKGRKREQKNKEEYWVRATLVEALFDLGKAAPEPWMINTTEEQLAKLRALQR